ncbi:MAG: RluA family pseudouridine synthase [Malacoplasma sp.]|nr:RluA family pseudouridine synthase [Malacoplasma sp.]
MTQIEYKKDNKSNLLKDFIKNKFPNLSFSKINKSITKGDIKVNNKKVFWNYKLDEGDLIQIYLRNSELNYDSQKLLFLEAKDDLNIIYEDKNIIVVSKPKGVVCQQDSFSKYDFLNNRIKKYLYLKNDNSYLQTNLCHRLDKDASGLCLAAKNYQTLKKLNKVWNSQQIKKYYQCLCFGFFEKETDLLKFEVYEDKQLKKMVVNQNKNQTINSITSYKVLKQYESYALVEIQLLTGKKHQIRVHMAHIKHPILGDFKYNHLNNLNYQNLCLIAYKIVFNFSKPHYLNYLNNVKIEIPEVKFK